MISPAEFEEPKELEDDEEELPSRSQFYIFFHPDVEDESCTYTSTFLNNSDDIPLAHDGRDILRLPALKEMCPTHPVFSIYNEGRPVLRSKRHDFNLDLVAEEYAQLVRIAEDNEKLINEKEIVLNMQDKELEAIIAEIAEVCELNVTITRDMREAKRHRDYVRDKAREYRVKKLGYETGALMLEKENDELKVENEKLQNEINCTKEKNKMLETNMGNKGDLKDVSKDITIDAGNKDKQPEENQQALNDDYECMRTKCVSNAGDEKDVLNKIQNVYTARKTNSASSFVMHTDTSQVSNDSMPPDEYICTQLNAVTPHVPRKERKYTFFDNVITSGKRLSTPTHISFFPDVSNNLSDNFKSSDSSKAFGNTFSGQQSSKKKIE